MIKSDRVLLHHPVGEGEYHYPIKPFWTTTSQFVIPTIEEALFGEFTRKRHHRLISSYIFHESIEWSRSKLLGWIQSIDELIQLADICRGRFIEIEKFVSGSATDQSVFWRLARKYPKRDFNASLDPSGGESINVNPPAWTPRFKMPTNLSNYSYWATVWIRINCTCALLEYVENLKHEKATLFMNAHIPVMRYLDSFDDPSDECINIQILCSLYQRLGKSRFDEDRNLIRIDTQRVQLRQYPLQVLEQRYPTLIWRPNDVTSVNLQKIEDAGYAIPNMMQNHFLVACLSIMVQCKELHATEPDMSVRDHLWFYHCCFLDIVAVLSDPSTATSDAARLQLLFPHDSRCFTGYDLPNAFHVLSAMPLWGEQLVPTFALGKFIQKSLPFAGARRTLIEQTEKNITSDTTFWKLFSSLFYCMLVDTYPEHISRNRERCFDLQKLLSIIRLVGDREKLKETLARKSFKTPENEATFNKENDKGCYIVFTAFRLWLLMMVHGQTHYQMAISECLDWKLFVEETTFMAATIRRDSEINQRDVFAVPREVLKGAKNKIYRYRKSNVVDTVLGNMMEGLEKQLFKELEEWEVRLGGEANASAFASPPIVGIPTQSEFIAKLVVHSLKYEIPVHIKTNLLNLLIHVPKSQWIDPLTLSIMRVPEYGGISEFPIALILRLIDIYFNKGAKPKEFEYFISLFDTGIEFKIISWYFHVLHILDGVDFELLLESQVEQIDRAMMTTRYVLYPGQVLPMTAFNVFFTICCGKIKTLFGSTAYGHEDIAYDAIRRTYICAKSHKKVQSYNSDDMAFSEYERVKKQVRKQRKEFNFMPCKDNPVLCIDMRGFMLIWGKDSRYMHCPECAAFHKYEWTGWKGREYKCPTCRSKATKIHCTCHVCGMEATMNAVVEEPLSVNGIRDVFQHLYFCKKHQPKQSAAPKAFLQ